MLHDFYILTRFFLLVRSAFKQKISFFCVCFLGIFLYLFFIQQTIAKWKGAEKWKEKKSLWLRQSGFLMRVSEMEGKIVASRANKESTLILGDLLMNYEGNGKSIFFWGGRDSKMLLFLVLW